MPALGPPFWKLQGGPYVLSKQWRFLGSAISATAQGTIWGAIIANCWPWSPPFKKQTAVLTPQTKTGITRSIFTLETSDWAQNFPLGIALMPKKIPSRLG